MEQPNQPIYIMPEGAQKTTGKNAQRMNISAAQQVAEAVKTTLGPKGMDKMLVDSTGEVTVTNDGVTILKEMAIEHPSAKMIVEVAKTQETEVGDGTTSAVIIAGELLKKAENLMDQKIHSTIITKGYRKAAETAKKILNNMSEDIKLTDDKILKNIAITAMTGKGAETAKEKLGEIAVKAIKSVTNEKGNKIDTESIKIEAKTGGSIEESELIKGIILDKEATHPGMPKKILKAKIALINSSIEIKSTEIEAKIQITNPEQMQQFIDQEEKMMNEMINKIISSGANMLVCQKGIDDIAQHMLAKKGIYAIRRVKPSDMKKISKATKAEIITNIADLKKESLGKAGKIEQKRVGEEEMTYIEECDNPKAVTILLRGGTEQVTEEIKRAMEDSLGDVKTAIEGRKAVAGAGSTEIELARNIQLYSEELSGREQLAVKAFAEAIEIIPKTLAENAGLDPIDIITELKLAHNKGNKWTGINIFTGKMMDAWKEGVIEPLKIKTQAISSATEVANMILRIDDIIIVGQNENPKNRME